MTATRPQTTHDPIDLTDPEFAEDPFRTIERIRSAGRVVRGRFLDTSEVLLVAGDEEVQAVLSDRRFVVDPDNVPGGDTENRRAEMMRMMGVRADLVSYLTDTILDKDGVDHVRLRKLVSRTFTVRRVNELRPRIRRAAEELLAALPEHAEADGTVDLLAHFAYPLPITVIGDLVGVPTTDRARWRAWSDQLVGFDRSDPSQLNDAMGAAVEHARHMIAERRETEHDDLLGALVRTRDEDGDRLTESELITLVFTLIIAGYETTAHLIGNGTRALLEHPEQWEMLRSDRDLMPAAVHEMLREGGTALLTRPRYAAEPLEIGGTEIAAGTAVIAVIAGANRDPDVHEDPYRFDITRHHGRPGEAHQAFSHGMHYCLGAALARTEGEVAFDALLSAYPDLSLVPGRPPRRQVVPAALRLEELPVRLGT
ncbi:cytochrome P450 [Nocardiopsis sp. HNM0947]|uniref:Cytochrome P450 n=1 Tax=Nocardiopsis coralli TaxID=2772213 RepID=A0ABR9PCH2_9ACTN|nr:cytochrome P450 [Nocardiopsis coralli]MBE3001430.1 cytochrome P450 [Nocardiopsis coralli]